MTPAERKRLAAIGALIAVARDAEYAELRPSALYEASKRIKAMLKRKPWQPRSRRYQLVDVPLGNGVELTPDELARLVEALGPGDGELREKLRTL